MNLRRTRAACALAACAWLFGCATQTPPVVMTPEEEYEPERVQVPSPLIEYPPIEPVEPPIAQPAPEPAVKPSPAPPETVAIAPPSIAVSTPPSPAPAVAPQPVADVEFIALLADLQRYGGMNNDDVKRELGNVTQALARQRTDANRVRLAVLYTLSRANPQDDQRALQLLENVSPNTAGSPAVKQLALVLHVQISGRQRAVREEQQKADAALQKLEALRQMERSLIRDRARSGGGGGGGGSGGGSGGGGGGGSGGN